MKYAIVGNPNCGKTTVFNALTGMNQKVGNWSWVTVDKKTGRFTHKNQDIELVDLPGIYSLSSTDDSSIDEQIASRFIIEEKPDAIINVIDASNLERNLYLTLQLMEMHIPIILAVNMIDVAKTKGIIVHFDKLSRLLNMPVIPIIGRKKIGIAALKDQLIKSIAISNFDLSSFHNPSINRLKTDIEGLDLKLPAYFVATRLSENDPIINELVDSTHHRQLQALKRKHLQRHGDETFLSSQARYKAAGFIIDSCCDTQKQSKHSVTEAIDKLCMNKYLGIPIFLFVMYLMFEFTITIGGALQPLFDSSSNVLFIQGMTHLGIWLGLPLWLTAVIAQGIGLGINTVVTFIPQIGCMFLFLSFLEDSGYMARAAFVMDKLMQAIGLPGKAFVPLIVGFGCNVPAVMATRTLETRRDRLMTIMMAPFISCGARLAIFAVFASAFFPQGGALVVFGLYLIGILGAILTGFIVKYTLLKGQSAPFVMEIPVYHLPNLKTIWIHSWGRLKRFVFRAGKVIIPICVLIGTLNSIEPNGQVVAGGSQHSILSYTGRAITPVLSPIGIKEDNWQATVGLLTGTLAKEVVVGTLNTLYTQEKPETLEQAGQDDFNLWAGLKDSWSQTIDGFKDISVSAFLNPFAAGEADANMDSTAMGSMVIAFGSMAAAFAYMLFVLLYIPCASTIGTIARESSRGWAIMSVTWSTTIAYFGAVIVYQATCLMTTPAHAIGWIIASIAAIAAVVFIMRHFAKTVRFESRVSGCGGACATAKAKSCH
ncbi:MAG: Fe(2+) transporter permease subunit FeoB [Francisellaceae bacterium]